MNDQFLTLIKQLQDKDNNARSEAAVELGKMGSPEAVDTLLDALCTDGDLNVVEDVTWALGRMKDLAIESLIATLGHEDAKIRHRVVHVLGKFGDKRAVDSLIEALEDADESVRYKATIALGQIGDSQAIGAIIGRLNDKRLENRQCATVVLEGFWSAAVLLLIEALSAANVDARELIIGVLGEIGDQRAVEPLLACLHDEDAEVRIVTATALGQIGDSQAVEELQNSLLDESERVRLVAKAALKMIEMATEG